MNNVMINEVIITRSGNEIYLIFSSGNKIKYYLNNSYREGMKPGIVYTVKEFHVEYLTLEVPGSGFLAIINYHNFSQEVLVNIINHLVKMNEND